MDVFQMIVGIVLIVSISVVSLVKMKVRYMEASAKPRTGPDTDRLREEVRQLKERLAVIERITIERENSLEREIESLRER